MTEQEWMECKEPASMLDHIRGNPAERKMRLFVRACVWHILPFVADQRAVDDWKKQDQDAEEGAGIIHDPNFVIEETAKVAGTRAAKAVQASPRERIDIFNRTRSDIREAQSNYLRDIFGNPFHAVSSDHDCFPPTVTKLAEAIYETRAFDHLPILADALEDGGCTNADILNHCRLPGVHVRGCWVVDLVLGRE